MEDTSVMRSIRVEGFRAHSTFSSDVGHWTLFSGENGVGKTAILEAVYFWLSGGTIPPDRTIDSMVRHEHAHASVGGTIHIADAPYIRKLSVTAFLEPRRRVGFAIESGACSREKFLVALPLRAILVRPLEMNLVFLGPDVRRTFLDTSIALAAPAFDAIKRQYTAALRARNACIKGILAGKRSGEELAVWDAPFVRLAVAYMAWRRRFVSELVTASELFLADFFPATSTWKPSIKLVSKVGDITTEAEFLSLLQARQEKDLRVGYTTIGPHTDDLGFFATTPRGELPLADFASRGECKVFLLALMLGRTQVLQRIAGHPFVLLLDDIFSELDNTHLTAFLGHITHIQTLFASQQPNLALELLQPFQDSVLHVPIKNKTA